MEFKYKSGVELKAMTDEEANVYVAAKSAHEAQLVDNKIKEATKGFVPQSELDELKEINRTQGEDISTLKEGRNINVSKGFNEQLEEFLVKNHEAIKTIHNSRSGLVEFKAVGNMTTASGVNTSPPNITGTQQAPLSNVNLREFNVADLTSSVDTSLAAYPYTEAKPKDGDYTFVAEGLAKPQIDFSYETKYATPVKSAAWIRLTEESIKDVVGLQSVANDLLRKKHDLKKSSGILFGDGTSPNPKGATLYGRTFVAGGMALKVINPNFMDVVNACITDIATTHNYQDETPYMANLVMINPIDFYLEMVSAKDGQGLPLYPTASLFNQVVIGGVTIKPEETIPSGKIFVSDMSKYNTTNYVPYTVQIGWVNDDFIKNQFVILAESRFHAFVRKLDEKAFIYDNIATVKTAIKTV